jgi:hypothetical protein
VRTQTCPLQIRREKFRRIVRVSVELAILLLFLWLLMDVATFHAALAEIQRSVTEPVTAPAASQPSVNINPNWAAAGLLGILARFMPALAVL